MDKKEFAIAERSYYIIEKAKEDLLELCNGQSVSLTISVLITSADLLIATAKEIREQAGERKDVWDFLIRRTVEETLQ